MSFLNPLFLIGLSALAIPILIHLVKRERAPKIYFSSLRFLRPISQRTLKYLRLHNLLLMLLRMLALLLMVFAFARPYFHIKTSVTPPKARARALAILIDNSMSMGYADHLARAKRKAAELVDKMGPNDKAFVAAVSSRWDQRTQMTSERGVLKSAIDQISLTPNATDYLLTLGAAGNSLLEAEADREKVIHLVSDFQKSGLRNDADFHIPPTISLEPYDIAPAASTNLTVAEVDFVKGAKTPEDGNVNVRVVNFGVEKKSITVKLFLNGREIGRHNVTVDKNSAQGVAFEKVALFPGANRGKVELIDDPLPMDNSYFFIIDADRRVKILLVNNSRSPRRESVFVERALSRGGSLPFALTVRAENEIKPDDVAAGHLIVLNEIDKLSEANLKMVRAALEQGKGVLFSVGERVDTATFNRNFSGMAPARLKGIKSARKPERDPLLLTFHQRRPSDLPTVCRATQRQFPGVHVFVRFFDRAIALGGHPGPI
jgi:hypothetical protein